MSRTSKIKEANPELLEDQDFRELLESADKIHDVKVIAEMPGGQALIAFLLNDIVGSVHTLTAIADTAPHTELVAIIARMKANIATARFLTTAKGDVENLDQMIADTLRE